jgi:micrococcal nuclease
MLRRVVAALAAGLLLLAPAATPAASMPVAAAGPMPITAKGPFAVTKVVDGDTIWVRTGPTRVKVRLIGLDTPETVDPRKPVQCFGPEASRRAQQLLERQRVFLEFDPSQGQVDRYGRALAYVWLPDGRLFNEVMIAEGFATEYTYDRAYKYQRDFRSAQAAAQSAKRGLWSACR